MHSYLNRNKKSSSKMKPSLYSPVPECSQVMDFDNLGGTIFSSGPLVTIFTGGGQVHGTLYTVKLGKGMCTTINSKTLG